MPRLVALVCVLSATVAAAEDYRLESVDGLPSGVSAAISQQIHPDGVRVLGPKRPLCDLWQMQSLPVTADFKPTAAVKYPFEPGQLVGILQVPRRSELTDFRGIALEAGTYTLRYGRQPVDGNHVGTSDLADFLVAIPAEHDENPAVLTDVKALNALSAKASGTTHPAIFSLQPADGTIEEPKLVHDEAREFWILQGQVETRGGELPLRMVIVGKSEG